MAKKAYIGVDGKARKIKKGYIGVENFVPRALPEGYTQLSHIEATGAQRFDTGFVPNQDTRVVMGFDMTGVSSEGWASLFSTRTDGASRAFALYSKAGFTQAYDQYANSTLQPKVSLEGRHVVDKNKNVTFLDGTVISTFTYTAFTGDAPLRLLWESSATPSNSYPFIGKVDFCQVYDNGTMVRDYVPCINPSDVVGLYDMVNGTFGGSATSTPFVAGDTYNSLARKIKKAYIGIGGVARPCWSGGELAYYGTITALKYARQYMGATSNANYALFGGGRDSSGTTGTGYVEAYDASLVRTNPDSFGGACWGLMATSVGSYAVFGGGSRKNSRVNNVYAYNESLSKSQMTDGLNAASVLGAATTIGDYGIFAGGQTDSTWTATTTACNSSLTKSSPTSLSAGRSQLKATSIGNYALFAGGVNNGTASTVVDTFNESLTRGTATALPVARFSHSATTVGNYALFVGGQIQGGEASALAVAYDSSLTRTNITALSAARADLAGTTVGEFAIFGGGQATNAYGGGVNLANVDVYDSGLTRTIGTSLSGEKANLSAATIGNYALFAGGYSGSYLGTVDAYTVA